MLVYRDGKRDVRTAELLDELIRSVRDAVAEPANESELLLTALLRAGALECALTDADSAAASNLAELTDSLADALVCGRGSHRKDAEDAKSLLNLNLPATVRLSLPEGFAYYALDPLAYAAAVEQFDIHNRPVYVIGLRTIGTTLSAIVVAAARRRGARAERMTVRPVGHPWDRKTEFSSEQRLRILDAATRRAMFFIVDEGPGLSGSSLVSVADALAELGIAQSDIVVLCAHAPDPANLRSRRAVACWSTLQVVTAGQPLRPPENTTTNWSGGLWRAHLYRDPAEWPPVWPQVERLKFVSNDGTRVYKFEGLGPYGEKSLARARAAAEAGYSPPVKAAGNGFAAYTRIDGAPMKSHDLDTNMIETLARYCYFRQREVRTEVASLEPLCEMVRVNLREEFGVEHDLDDGEIVRPMIADARMTPYEWLRDPSGRAWKTDVASHGDDHFYPGATDIAWDLAGAIVEWHMNNAATDRFVERYCSLAGDDARARLPFYLRAYAAFRLGFCRMAAEACAEERERLTNAAEYYASLLLPEGTGAKAQRELRSCSPA